MALFKTKFESKRQDWETPDSIFKPLDEEFNFDIDVCADAKNAKCKRFFSLSDDGLSRQWEGACWMNPPFGSQGKWVEKAFVESMRNGTTVVCLLPARTNTNWWHKYCMLGEIRFIKGRPKFKGAKHGLPQPLAIVIFRNQTSEGAEFPPRTPQPSIENNPPFETPPQI